MQEYQAHLKEHGFVLIKDFFTPDVIQLCKSFLDLSFSHGLRKPESNPYLEGEITQILPSIFANSILLAYTPLLEQIFEAELIPSYIFFREYGRGSSLKIHRDRDVCEYSTTILINKDGEGISSLVFCDDEDSTNPVEVILEEGDAIIFKGAKNYGGRWHYRPKVEQNSITQVFLHYVSPGNTPEDIFPRPIYRN